MSKIFYAEKFLNIICDAPRLNGLHVYLMSSYSNFVAFSNVLENLACDVIQIVKRRLSALAER